VVLAAVYLLRMLQDTIWGPLTKQENRELKDLGGREIAALVPLCVLMLWIGVAPRWFLEPSRPAIEGLLATYKAKIASPAPSRPELSPMELDANGRVFAALLPPKAGESQP
jgi:NADH:ubiquinone oxidoreductase subunit 4 (subunit M)